ncbi:MAG: N-acetylneuraminate synthase family protein [Spirochaetales bacterium]|nr:N-acetylneuraminate synthase family protein [Spirochaetales bacterium]
MKRIILGSREIREDSRPYIIAEIGVNHEGSLETARHLIDLAKEGGADAAKFQTYKAETLASRNSPAYWDTTREPTLSQFELFKKHDSFGQTEYEELAKYCSIVGIDFLSTPFDLASVSFLDPWMPFFKIASADITVTPLLRAVAVTGKPVVLSTGCSSIAEIEWAIRTLKQAGAKDIALMHCILNYPCQDGNAHLGMMNDLARVFPDHIVGYSDHTHPDTTMFVLTAAVAMGARIIEKHFTHDKSLPGNDHYHAMDVLDLKTFRANLDRFYSVKGNLLKQPIDSEQLSRRNARRSIVVQKRIEAGEVITESHLTFKRPAFGISPVHWDEIIGLKATGSLEKDHILTWQDVLLS